MPFIFEDTALQDVKIVTPRVFPDGRGSFLESYKRTDFVKAGIDEDFVQDNHSKSAGGVIRGLHYQKAPHAQAKLLRCVIGSIYDVVVDMRKGSPTFGKWVGVELSADNHKMIFVPEGFAHGFAALSEHVEILYKVSKEYCKAAEGGVIWNDPNLGIEWRMKEPTLSEKDAILPSFEQADNNFVYKAL